MFQNSFSRCHLQNNSVVHLCHIYICHSEPNWPGIIFLLHENNMEDTWNFVSPEKWEPCEENESATAVIMNGEGKGWNIVFESSVSVVQYYIPFIQNSKTVCTSY